MIKTIILAAGEGTRMKSKLPKVLHNICGQPMINYVLDSARGAGSEKNYIIVGHGKDKVMDTITNEDIGYIDQPMGEGVPYGTGYAVMQAKEYIKDSDIVLILCGDTPLLKGDTLNEFIKYHKKEKYDATVLTATIDNPKGYGRIIRGENGQVLGIVEEKDASKDQKKVMEINSGVYCFSGKHLKDALDRIDNNNAQREYYLTDTIKILNDLGFSVGGFKIEDSTEINGINSRIQLSNAENIMRNRINEKLMSQGVTLIDPDNTYIHKMVKIGKDTVIYPNVFIEGSSTIGEDCTIGHNSKIVDSTIGDGVTINTSTILESTVGNNTSVGPYAYIRPQSHIGNNVKIGDFVEVKKSKIGNNTKASHLAYIGDAQVGDGVNIGCGVVFVNYNGKDKSKTIVEDGAFIGSNSNLVAPVTIKKKAYIAAGSTIIDDVKEGDLSIARARQVNKQGWVSKKNPYKNK
ncbi:bifunctional UDP-N-acetylglucosamine diphosphorylase/glucosamine-1-phosphate N-acetyltransferase GlmU [Clostridiisalibacter paucivorans]|uniref:bifunctional UDP-N-acetylglucosamine diphosphorylase/glucosamine-1-phosphate N-acetyltransferase GlmU n=1 Tax=Clostridiisalibacter paucivorans TaxID=408753 RepID=UPI00047A8154|nr:bifunctional UDP-N-acetylglucosamine diphosphorylase/glucosamine-1-phosphate N-acetyltransferase GlmU [Clostridiisalibacter paucivorans]